MKSGPGVACLALALAALLAPAAHAQSLDGFVLPQGMARVELLAGQRSYDSRFDAQGVDNRLGSELSGDLTPDRFAALQPFVATLADFLAATQQDPGASPSPPDPASLSLGHLDATATSAHTTGAARLSIGILPRLEIGATLSIGRNERVVQRLRLEDGSLGINPDPTGNRDLLATIGWAPLGDSPLLPTADSPMGLELQSRVQALTGGLLTLPDAAAAMPALETLLLDAYGFPPLAYRLEQWRLGDLHLEARGLLLSTFGSAPAPTDASGLDARITLTGGLRLPTGSESDTVDLFFSLPTAGISEFDAGAIADLFIGPRFWATGAISRSFPRETEFNRRATPLDAPLADPTTPGPIRYSPAARTALTIVPRFRLDESISIDATYDVHLLGDATFSPSANAGDAVRLEGGTLQELGIGLRYSSLPAYWADRARIPAEVALRYHRTLSGPQGMPAGGRVTVSASIIPRLW